jgi:hypothetical protein
VPGLFIQVSKNPMDVFSAGTEFVFVPAFVF